NTNDNKRSRDQAEFSSPEESPTYKKLLEKYQRECELGKATRDLYYDIHKQYVKLQNTVDDIQQDHRTGKTSNRGHFQKLKNSYDREPYDFTNYANQNGSNQKKIGIRTIKLY